MNFVYLHTHDSGRYMQPYGIAADNPNLMRLARESFMFRQAHATAPTCSCSRTGMLSGMAPHTAGMFGLAHRGFHMTDFSRHLSHYLHENGYYTVLAGVQHEAKNPDSLGYDEAYTRRLPHSRERDQLALDHALEFLRSGRRGDKPFFLSFGMASTHLPYEEPYEIEEDFLTTPFPVVNNADTRHDYAGYLQSLRTADRCVGTLLDELDALGLRDDTMVMFTTDHGISFPDMKTTLKDSGTGVALFIRHPAIGRGLSDAMVSHLDVFPTVCDALGLEKPDWLAGKSLLPLMRGEVSTLHEYVFSEVTYHAAYEPQRAVRSDRMKLIRYFADQPHKIFVNVGDHAAKDYFVTSPLSGRVHGRDELYDLVGDPVERINVVDMPEYRAEYEKLSAVLEAWMRETNDPLLDGPIPLQPGQITNLTTAFSPSEPTYDYLGNETPKKQK